MCNFNMKRLYAALVLFLIMIFQAYHCEAQVMKASERGSQAYINITNDMRCYDLIKFPDKKEYTDYCKFIREKIRQKLENKNLPYYSPGDVNILFAVNSDGSLVDINIEERSTSDERLAQIAAHSIKEASPFPPFPEGLDLTRMSFGITISFKKR